MPAGPIGSCWQGGSWADTAWEAQSWGTGVAAPDTPQRPSTSAGGFASPTIYPDFLKQRRRATGGSLAAVLVATEGVGRKDSVGAADTPLAFVVSGEGVKRGAGQSQAYAPAASEGQGVADDFELLLALYIAQHGGLPS